MRFHLSQFYLFPLLLLTTSIPSTLAALNCHGSARCAGHHGRENDLITSITNAMPTWSTFANSKTVACVSTGSNGLRGGGDWGFCAFFQGIGDATFGRDKILDMLGNLKGFGGCNPCGSIPVGWPGNNETGGELTVNFVYSIPCVGYCSNEAGGKEN